MLRYGLALVLAAGAVALTVGLRDLLAGSVFLLFFPAIIGAAWFGGFAPALMVVAVAVTTADVLFVDPVGELRVRTVAHAVWLGLYVVVAGLVGWVTARLAGARAEAERLLEKLSHTHGALEESEQRFRRMADHAPVLIWEAGPDGGCTRFNRPWLEFTGRRLEEEVGDGWQAGIHPEDRARYLAAYRAVVADRRPFRMEYRLRRRDGEYRWILSEGVPRRGPTGEFHGYIGSCIDIHDHVQAEQELETTAAHLEELSMEQEQLVEELQERTADAEAARLEAQLANEAKSRFLAVMSHELRTPLNAILGYADLLAGGVSGEINDVQTRHISRIRGSVMHLRDLIDQILSLSRIEAGREEVHVAEFDLSALVREAVDMVTPQAARRGLELDVRVPAHSIPVHGDEGKVRQIVLNLLSNAVKFTERGSIDVRVGRTADAVTVSVSDTGIGIAAADVQRIFDPFTQVDQSMTRRSTGTGLGLSVSRHLAEMMGGTVTVTTEEGRGSTFVVRLPAQRASQPADAALAWAAAQSWERGEICGGRHGAGDAGRETDGGRLTAGD